MRDDEASFLFFLVNQEYLVYMEIVTYVMEYL